MKARWPKTVDFDDVKISGDGINTDRRQTVRKMDCSKSTVQEHRVLSDMKFHENVPVWCPTHEAFNTEVTKNDTA